MGRYKNGKVPHSALVHDRHGNPWLPGTYRKWVAFQQYVYDATRERTGTGVWLYVSPKANGAYNTYRDEPGQFALRAWWTAIGMPLMASIPGKSSHGAVWTGQTNGRYGLPKFVFMKDAGAFDVANWASVPWDIFETCAERAGLLVNIVVPEERWHVVDLDPWDTATTPAVPASIPSEEDDMYTDADRARDQQTHTWVAAVYAATFGPHNLPGDPDKITWENVDGTIGEARYGLLSTEIHTQQIVAAIASKVGAKMPGKG